jgi:translocation and assembly module TamB
LKLLGAALGLALLAAAAVAVVVWNKPGWALQAARPLLPELARSAFSIGKITGNPRAGYELENVSLNIAGRPYFIDSVKFNIEWLALVPADRRVRIEYFSARVHGSTVTVRGSLRLHPLSADLSLASTGRVEGGCVVKGSERRWEVEARADWEGALGPQAGTLSASGSGLDGATLKAEGRLELALRHSPLLKLDASVEGSEFSADLDVSNLRISTPVIDAAHLSVRGSTSSHRFHLTVRSGDVTLEARGRGESAEKRWRAEWTHFRVRSHGDWRNVGSFETVIEPPSYRLHNLRLTNGSARLIFDGALNAGEWDRFSLRVENLNLALLNEFGLSSVPLKGTATGAVVLKGPLRQPTGSISLEVKGAEIEGMKIGDIDGKALLSPELLRVEQLHVNSAQGTIRLAGRIPLEKGRPQFSDVEFVVKATDYDPAEALKLFFDFETAGARLNADMKIERNAGAFAAEGVLRLEAEKFVPVEHGPELRRIVIVLRGAGESLRIERGEADTGKKGKLSVSGTLDVNGPRIRAIADRFAFRWRTGISGELSADLELLGAWEALVFKGVVDILSADYEPDKKKDDKKPEARGRRAGEGPDKEGGAASPFAMEVRVSFDRDVWYKHKQTSIELKGNLDLRKSPGDETRIFGKIEVVRGAYVAYGRVFDVEEGSLVFSGNVPVDPFLGIRALYVDKVSKMRIYLVLTGPASKPRLTLTSEPPLEEADIISVLATGKPLYQLGEGQGGGSQQVAQNLVAGYLAEGVRKELQDIIRLDVLRVQLKDPQSTDIVAGKNISRDFFISYGQTLGPGGEQRIEAEYNLTKRWGLEGRTTSLGRYVIDLLFKFGFK